MFKFLKENWVELINKKGEVWTQFSQPMLKCQLWKFKGHQQKIGFFTKEFPVLPEIFILWGHGFFVTQKFQGTTTQKRSNLSWSMKSDTQKTSRLEIC